MASSQGVLFVSLKPVNTHLQKALDLLNANKGPGTNLAKDPIQANLHNAIILLINAVDAEGAARVALEKKVEQLESWIRNSR